MNYGRYEIEAELGRGSMGIVYKAYDPQIERTIALKVLREDRVTSDEFVRRFLKEARAVGRLSHPGIVTVYDVGQDHGSIYIAMEFLQGIPLNELMSSRKFSPEEIIDIAVQTIRALNYAHRNGIVHRDIKPPNIIYSPEGAIRVTDFGIARIEDPEGHQMTQAGEILGTPLYMSPEQIGGKTLDGKSDIYSLGVILYQLATGKRPFEGSNLPAIFLAITQETPDAPHMVNPAVPEKLSRLIMQLLEKEPSKRFAGGDQLIGAFKSCLTVETAAAAPSVPPPAAAKGGPATGKYLGWLAVLVICAGLAGYLGLRPGSKSPHQPANLSGQATADGQAAGSRHLQNGNGQSAPTGSQAGTISTKSLDLDLNQLLRQATSLSIAITDLPKKEMVLKSARELGKISPRYQEDVKRAEDTYNAARDNQRKKLEMYIEEISSWSRNYPAAQTADAMARMAQENVSPRQKNVMELSATYLKSLHNGDTLDPEQVLDDFSKRFNNFSD